MRNHCLNHVRSRRYLQSQATVSLEALLPLPGVVNDRSILFSPEDDWPAIRKVLEGGQWTPPDLDLNAPADREASALVRRLSSLTPQQVRVLMVLSQGLLNKQIAYELSVSEATVKAHVSAILQKLGVESRTQAVILAAKIEKMQALAPAP